METLTNINCPFEKKDKYGIMRLCNRICVKVEAGSKGEVWCRSCKLKFNFEVDSQNHYRPIVKVQHENTAK